MSRERVELSGGVSDHNDLGSIQGGAATERYHLTAAEHAALGGGASEASWGAPPSAADYADAKAKGASTGVTFVDNSNSDAISIDTSKDELGVDIPAGTDRAQGILRTVEIGDFVYGVRLGFRRFNSAGGEETKATTASVLAWGSVFVDGLNAADDNWFGTHKYLGGDNYWAMRYYRFSHIGGTIPKFDTYNAYTSMGLRSYPNEGSTMDFWVMRKGTDLYLGSSEPGGIPSWDHKYGVGVGAGLVGIRSQTLTGETDYLKVFVLKDYLGDTVFPE